MGQGSRYVQEWREHVLDVYVLLSVCIICFVQLPNISMIVRWFQCIDQWLNCSTPSTPVGRPGVLVMSISTWLSYQDDLVQCQEGGTTVCHSFDVYRVTLWCQQFHWIVSAYSAEVSQQHSCYNTNKNITNKRLVNSVTPNASYRISFLRLIFSGLPVTLFSVGGFFPTDNSG